MAIVIPPWLQAPDTAGEFLKGAQIGSSIAAEKARLAQEQERAMMAQQARQQQLQQQMQLRQASLQTRAAYEQAQIGLREQALNHAKAVTDAKLKDAAMTAMDRQGFESSIAGGMSIPEAAAKYPRAISPQAAMSGHLAAQKNAEGLGRLRLDETIEHHRALEAAAANRNADPNVKIAMTSDPTKLTTLPRSQAAAWLQAQPVSSGMVNGVKGSAGYGSPLVNPVENNPINRALFPAPPSAYQAPFANKGGGGGAQKPPAVGEVYKGHIFTGGAYNDPRNWKKVEAQAADETDQSDQDQED